MCQELDLCVFFFFSCEFSNVLVREETIKKGVIMNKTRKLRKCCFSTHGRRNNQMERTWGFSIETELDNAGKWKSLPVKRC